MSEDTLVHVARLPQFGSANEIPDALWLDMQSLRFMVVPVANGVIEQVATPVEDYLHAHPDRTDMVRAALAQRMQDLPTPISGARNKLLARRSKERTDELLSRVTEANCHPEISTGKPVGNEIW